MSRPMTLRHRLLLVYLIVVLLSVATVGVAVMELKHSRQILGDLQHWNDLVVKVQKLRTAFERDALLQFVHGETPPPPEDAAGFPLLLEDARRYLDFDLVRWALNVVDNNYREWGNLVTAAAEERRRPGGPDAPRLAELEAAGLQQTQVVRRDLDHLTRRLELQLDDVVAQAAQQDTRTRILLLTVLVLTALHVALVGWLLRRWLLRPMEQLNRQVEALARDEPPAEPLLTAPLEMANLAGALDRARQSLGALRERLIDTERMTTIGQFAAQLAHNLRNPLASIRAAAQVAARHRTDDAYTCERMAEVVASVDRLNQWVARLMEVARREPTPTCGADVVPTLHRVRDALAPELSVKELTLEITAPQGGLSCVHDPATLEHALIAMMTNAIEASPPGGAITLRAEAAEEDGRPALGRISVEDRGCGLPGGDPEQIFEFAYSTKQRGMGLGLALARLALQRQGGAAHARNNPEGGATVYVELPLAAEGSAEPPGGQHA